jgi:hypothetical protein
MCIHFATLSLRLSKAFLSEVLKTQRIAARLTGRFGADFAALSA